jgi:hypothetical protein
MHFYQQRGLFATQDRQAQDQVRRNQNMLVQHLPKRISPLDETSDAGESLWGLEACESVSALIVICYRLAFIMIPFAFWLGHEDIQGASVPLTCSGILVSLFWASSGLLKDADGRHKI